MVSRFARNPPPPQELAGKMGRALINDLGALPIFLQHPGCNIIAQSSELEIAIMKCLSSFGFVPVSSLALAIVFKLKLDSESTCLDLPQSQSMKPLKARCAQLD